MDYNFSFESEDILDDDTIVNDETAVDEAGDDSETVNVTPDTKETSHNEVASAGGVSTGNNQDQLEMDPVAATESYILRQFGLSREDMEEAVEETIDEAETIPNADVLEGEEDPDIIATAVTDNAIIEGAAQDEVDSAGEVVDADDTPDLGVEDADSCMDGEDSAEAYLDWDIYGGDQSQESIWHVVDAKDIVHERDYPKAKAKVLEWYEKNNLRPIKKEEFKKYCDEKTGERGLYDKLFGRYLSYEYIDGISYVMSNQQYSSRSAVGTAISSLMLGKNSRFAGLVYVASMIKHIIRHEAIGNLYAIGISEDGEKVLVRKKTEFNVTKDISEYNKDIGNKKRIAPKFKR